MFQCFSGLYWAVLDKSSGRTPNMIHWPAGFAAGKKNGSGGQAISQSVQEREEKKLQVVISDTKHVPPSSIYALSPSSHGKLGKLGRKEDPRSHPKWHEEEETGRVKATSWICRVARCHNNIDLIIGDLTCVRLKVTTRGLIPSMSNVCPLQSLCSVTPRVERDQ